MKIGRFFLVMLLASIFASCDESEELFTPETGSVIDCQGNSYTTVKIGNQWWMAENLKSTQYDTDSERQPTAPATEIQVPVSTRPNNVNYGPYYVDVKDFDTPYSGNLSSEQRSKLGLLYTWAAAVGESSASNAQSRTVDYTAPRQGICPNGWHIPTDAEWTELVNYLGGHKNAGKKMKTSTAWYKGDGYSAGNNSSGFSVLPGGYDLGTNLMNSGIDTDSIPTTYGIGFDANFWSASANAWYRGFTCNSSEVKHFPQAKFYYFSVRCVRNAE